MLLMHPLPCTDNTFMHETCRRCVLMMLRTMKMSPDTSYWALR